MKNKITKGKILLWSALYLLIYPEFYIRLYLFWKPGYRTSSKSRNHSHFPAVEYFMFRWISQM